MAYFLKKSKNNKGTYLQIYESFYDPERKGTAQRSIEAIGYVHELQKTGIKDPICHFKEKVDVLNAERRAEKNAKRSRRIGDESPMRHLGYFPFKSLNNSLGVEKDFKYLQMAGGFRFDLFSVLSSLVYARICEPCSKSKTFYDVLPMLFEDKGYSLDQLYTGLEFLGAEYAKVIEMYNHAIEIRWPRDISRTYFDCTNFYFEIDREDDLRCKGPSKENRHDPIVGIGLLLDAACIPLGMKIFPGNESEKPVMRDVVADMKRRMGTTGKVVRVADKGLNCADNVADAVLSGDGYIFSKSVKQLPEKEMVWVVSEEGWKDIFDNEGKLRYRYKEVSDNFDYQLTKENGKKTTVSLPEKRIVTFNPKLAKKQRAEIDRQVEKARKLKVAQAKKSEYGDSAKYVTFLSVDDNGEQSDAKVACTLNWKAIKKARVLAGFNMLVTSEKKLCASEVYDIYHNLWRIEETFRVMKSELDARPVFLQKQDSITGHFLICYLAVLLLRLLQVKVLGNKFCSEQIMAFARGFNIVKSTERSYINMSKSSKLISELEYITGEPLGNYYLKTSEVNGILNAKLNVSTQDKP